ncbi:hypothetical protein [Streptomyces sp. NPDC006463]|uniref:hypothetical protein n=1 Tax=Streptomyces sp. NPDC006463 TaxID=3364746 RepID=UPI0036BD4DCD
MSLVAASAAPLAPPRAEVIDISVNGGVLKGVVPWGGTRTEVSARRAGGNRALSTSRTLSTGVLRKAAEMISISYLQAGR